MVDFREEFIRLSYKRCSQKDYIVKKHRHEHNKAMKSLFDLNKEMYAEKDHCRSIALELLNHSSEKVQLSIAAYCLRAGILVQEARAALYRIEKNSCDPMLSLDASLCAMGITPCLETTGDQASDSVNVQ